MSRLIVACALLLALPASGSASIPKANISQSFAPWREAGIVSHIDADGVTTHYYHADDQGSTLAVTDGSGNVSDQFAYTPYGELTGRSGTTSTPYQWLGGFAVRADDGPNIYAMQRRFYSADQKRFLSSDPSGIDSFANLYAYGNLNPAFFTDPYGLFGWENIAGGLRLAGGGFEALAGYSLAAAGAGFSTTGAGAAIGVPAAIFGAAVGTHGLDQIQAGARQAWSGSVVDSFTSRGLQATGMSQNAANLTDAGISVVGSFGAGFAATGYRAATLAGSASPEVSSASLLTQMKYYEVGQTSFESALFNPKYANIGNTLDRGAAILNDYGSLGNVWRAGSQTLGVAEGTLRYFPTPMANGALGSSIGALGYGVSSVARIK